MGCTSIFLIIPVLHDVPNVLDKNTLIANAIIKTCAIYMCVKKYRFKKIYTYEWSVCGVCVGMRMCTIE